MSPASDQSVNAYIGLGANLGNARTSVQQAIQALGQLPHTRLVCCSALYRSVPINSGGEDYINAVAEISTTLTAFGLLRELQALELAAGRERPYRNAPRTLDLDLLLYGNVQLESPSLVLPHPRMWQRAFVLLPLAQIAPQRVMLAQLQAVADQVVVRLD